MAHNKNEPNEKRGFSTGLNALHFLENKRMDEIFRIKQNNAHLITPKQTLNTERKTKTNTKFDDKLCTEVFHAGHILCFLKL